MIAKQVQGSDFKKVLHYVHSKPQAKLIDSNMTGKDPDSLANEFRISSELRKRITKCVYHVSLSVSPSENVSKEKWVKIARAYLKGMEFDENQYAVYQHRDREHDHIHIIASRIRVTDGSVVNDSWQNRRAEKLVRQLEQQFGLSQTPCSWEKRKRSPKTGEVRRQRRTGEITTRSQLQKLIEQSLQGNPSLEEFIRRLEAKGVSVRLRKSREGKIQGISYGLNGIAFQGRQLGKDYSWTGLEPNLAQEPPTQSHPTYQPEAIAVITSTNPENGVNHPTQAAEEAENESAVIASNNPKNGVNHQNAIAQTGTIPVATSNNSGENTNCQEAHREADPCGIAQSETIAQPKPSTVATPATINQASEINGVEQEKKRLRAKYLHLAAQVRQLPLFDGKEAKDIDTGVTLLSLKSGDDVKEAKLVLTQSNQVRQWHQDLPREDYLEVAAQYIQQVSRRVLALIQKQSSKQKSFDHDR
jgi:hypothetical protein